MFNKIISKSKKIFTGPQTSVLSAASVIMIMVVASRVLGLVRQRTLAYFFAPDDLSLFFAAFRLPDTIFEVLVFGTFASAFIPVFTKTIKKGNSKAWRTASIVVNIGLVTFAILAAISALFADNIYTVFAPGFDANQRGQIVKVARILFTAQAFFVVSYVLTGVLESLRRFLVPALAPLFYNLGIIVGTILLYPKLGLLAPAVGVFLGAALHFLIQLPLALKLGFRFSSAIRPNKQVKEIGKLAAPRVVELTFLQISKTVELFLSSLITTASYTYYTFGNTLQLLPVGLFGISIAKAALPTLASQADSPPKFYKTLLSSLYQIVFLVVPVATILIVLRIPIVRLVYGTEIFSWEATVQTGKVVSAFAVGIVFQSASALLARSFYARSDTKTPVIVSIISILVIISANFILISGFSLPVWGLAASFSLGSFFQTISLYYLINKRLDERISLKTLIPFVKSLVAALSAGGVMFFLLKIFDRSVWVKRLSFLGSIESTKVIAFERFVLDTRYTANLLILTIIVSIVGVLIYLGASVILRNQEVYTFVGLVRRILVKRKVAPIPEEEQEPVAPTPTDTQT
ncbi:MAG: murein biosynthesis integral membrane protein MurJ [Patescibacteria group bacterium]